MRIKVSSNITEYDQFEANDPFTQKDWESVGNPVAWWMKAEELKDVSEILYNEQLSRHQNIMDLVHRKKYIYNQYFLFLGYSIENLLKGIILKNNPTYLSNLKLKKDVQSHDLQKLTLKAEFEITLDEKVHLDRWTRSVLFTGKYPIPLEGGNILRTDEFDLIESKAIFDSLFSRLSQILLNGK